VTTATKVAIPQSPDELAEILNDAKRLKEIFADKDATKEFFNAYSRNVMNKDHEFAAQLREQVQIGMAEFLKANGGRNGPPVGLSPDGHPTLNGRDFRKVSTGRGAAYNKLAPGARKGADEVFESSAEFFQAIWPRMNSVLKNRKDLGVKLDRFNDIQTEIRNSFGSEVPADGGYLIPETLRTDILQLALETSIVRRLATVIPMETLRVPIPMIDDTSHVSSVFGGIVFYWTEEGAALTESQASFGRVVLDAKKLTGFASVPNELLADATAFSAFFDMNFPRALAWYEDLAFMTATGVGEPLGFLNAPAVVSVASGGVRTASTALTLANFAKMYASMLPSSLGSAVWICSIDVFPALAAITQSAPGVWMGGWTANNMSQTPPVSIFGRPVYFTEKVPKLGTLGDINFVDLAYYLIGDRQVMQAMSSEHYQFQNDKTAFRIIERLDGRPWLQSSITPHNNSAALSPFVNLATAS
jgi:HK97 family phage major capsid protein